MKIKIQSIKDFFKSKEKKGLKPIFFESIGDQNTPRDERLKNLINVLEKNGFKIKNKKSQSRALKKIGKYRIELCPKKNNLNIEKACKNHYYQLSEFFNCLEVTYTYKIH